MQIRNSGRRPFNRSPLALGFHQLRRKYHRRLRQYQLKLFGLWSASRGGPRKSSQAELAALAYGAGRKRPEGSGNADLQPEKWSFETGEKGFWNMGSGDYPDPQIESPVHRLPREGLEDLEAGEKHGNRNRETAGPAGGEGVPQPADLGKAAANKGGGGNAGGKVPLVPWYSGPLEGQGRKGSRDPRLGGPEGGPWQPERTCRDSRWEEESSAHRIAAGCLRGRGEREAGKQGSGCFPLAGGRLGFRRFFSLGGGFFFRRLTGSGLFRGKEADLVPGYGEESNTGLTGRRFSGPDSWPSAGQGAAPDCRSRNCSFAPAGDNRGSTGAGGRFDTFPSGRSRAFSAPVREKPQKAGFSRRSLDGGRPSLSGGLVVRRASWSRRGRSRQATVRTSGRPRFPLVRCLLFAVLIWSAAPSLVATLEDRGVLAPRQEESLPVDGALNQQYLHPDAGWLGAGSPEEDEKPGAADSSDAALGETASQSLWRKLWLRLKAAFSGSTAESRENPPASFDTGQKIRLYEYQSGQLLELDLEEYLVGVVAGEMPASFDLEALKAQAVAARTYAVNKLINGASPALAEIAPEADITNDTSINQTWLKEEERRKNWGSNFAEYEAKIRRAVEETRGAVLLYEGEIIDPLYHASCGGERTEDSFSVWGGEMPYLQSVACSGHEDPYSAKTTVLSLEEVDRRLGTELAALPVSAGTKAALCQVTSRSSSGRVLTASLSGKEFSGVELRSKLGLPSANFRTSLTDQGLEITSKGFGHGVGMCQYGADDYARQGLNYRQILLHYYTGCTLASLG